jgi:hypothetical protein
VCPDIIELTQPRKMGNGAIAKTRDKNRSVKSCHVTGKGHENVLEIQYENSKPTLLENGSALTRIAPSIAGMYISTPEYERPMSICEARVTPSQIARTVPQEYMRGVQ